MQMYKLSDLIERYSYETEDDFQDRLLAYLHDNKIRLVDFYGASDSDSNNKYVQLAEFVEAYSIAIFERWTRDRSSFYRRFKDVNGYTVARYCMGEYHSYWLIEKRG